MRPLAILLLVLPLAAIPVRASACAAAGTKSPAQTTKPHWVLDHYVYDASLREDWAVLVDCNHPAAPARMRLVPNTVDSAQATQRATAQRSKTLAAVRIQAAIRAGVKAEIKSGTAVEVLNGANQPASIHVTGTAMETAFFGQPIRVRLSSSGNFVRGSVRGPHTVQLTAAAKPLWGEP